MQRVAGLHVAMSEERAVLVNGGIKFKGGIDEHSPALQLGRFGSADFIADLQHQVGGTGRACGYHDLRSRTHGAFEFLREKSG